MPVTGERAIDQEFLRRVSEATHQGMASANSRPLLTLTYAQSVDGCITFTPLNPMALSGRESLLLTHTLRAAHDAILVGVRTVAADNPRLNVRLVEGESPRPVVLDTHLSMPLGARLLSGENKPLVAAGPQADPARERALTEAGATILRLPLGHDGLIDLTALVRTLQELGIRSIMVEGGRRVLTSFMGARLADQMIITIAPVVVGGVHAFGRFAFDPGFLPRLKDVHYGRFGEDLAMWGRPSWNGRGNA